MVSYLPSNLQGLGLTNFAVMARLEKIKTFLFHVKKEKFFGKILEAHIQLKILDIGLTCHLFQLDFSTYKKVPSTQLLDEIIVEIFRFTSNPIKRRIQKTSVI